MTISVPISQVRDAIAALLAGIPDADLLAATQGAAQVCQGAHLGWLGMVGALAALDAQDAFAEPDPDLPALGGYDDWGAFFADRISDLWRG